ncbi:MAG TPA: hypothetical protein VK890_01035, partial [Bacteroidia bacterium]|nr:hypothetical protein [Bacteroidia bacterium]
DTVMIPASVQQTFFNIYPLATNIKWSRSTLYANDNVKYIYRVKFRMGFYMISTSTDTSGSRFAEFSHEAYVPDGIWTKFESLLPTAEITQCEEGDTGKVKSPGAGHYSVMFTYSSDSSNFDGCVILDSAYNVLEIWKDIPHNSLPNSISKYIKTNFKTAVFSEEEGSMMIQQNGKTTYFVSLDIKDNGGSYWLFFDDKGTLTKKETHRWKTIKL